MRTVVGFCVVFLAWALLAVLQQFELAGPRRHNDYLDSEQTARRNLMQTGSQDKSIPLKMRQEWARDHGSEIPQE